MSAFFGFIYWVVIGFFALLLLLWILGFRVIRSDRVGVVEKWWSFRGSLKDSIIALRGEAGYQPDVLRGGIHFRTPLMYRVHVMPLVTISQGKIGYVFARDGVPLTPGQTLGKVIPGNSFESDKAFIEAGGQRGPQRLARRLVGGDMVEAPAGIGQRGDAGGGGQQQRPEDPGRGLLLVVLELQVRLQVLGGEAVDMVAVEDTMGWAHGSLR